MKVTSQTYWMWIIITCGVLFVSLPVQAEIPHIATLPLNVEMSELHKLWFDALQLLKKGEMTEANLKLVDLDLKKIEKGLKNLPEHSAVLLTYVTALRKQGNLPEARKLAESAKKLSPESATVYLTLARLRFAEEFTDFYGIARLFWRGLRLKYTDINTMLVYINNAASCLLVSGILVGAVFILFCFGYYRQVIFYSIKEKLPIPFSAFMTNILVWVVLGVVTLALGIFWGVLFLAALLLIPNVEGAAKWVLQGVLGFGCLIVGLLMAISVTFNDFDSDYLQALRDMRYGYYSARTIQELRQRLQDQPTDPYALFSLAYIAKNTGNFQEAIEVYEKIPGIFPDRAAAQNNLGNIYNLQFRKTKAQALYNKANEAYNSAMRMAPMMFEPRYNSGQFLLVGFNPEDANNQIMAARQFDNERFTLYSKYLEYKIFSVDASLSTTAILQKLYDQEALTAGAELAKKIWASGSRFAHPGYFSGACLALLILSSLVGPKKGAQPREQVNYCQMCGDPYTLKRKKTGEAEKLCTQCTYIFKKKAVVKPEERAKKTQQIEFRQRIRGVIAKIGSLCFPGAGQIYFGYAFKGIVLGFIFYLGLAIALLKGYLRILLTSGGSSGFSLTVLIISLVIVIGAYLWNVLDILKLSPKNQ